MEELFRGIVRCAGKIGIPEDCVNESIYLGHAQRFMNVTITSSAVFFADDHPMADTYEISMDLYIPPEENYRGEQKVFRLALEEEGFDDVSIEGQMFDTDAEKRRIIFNASATVMRGEE